MKKIENMTFSEFYKEFRLLFNLRYMANIIYDSDLLDQFYQAAAIINNPIGKKQLAKSVIEGNFDKVNRDAYVFYTLKAILENGRLDMKEDTREIEDKCREVLKKSDFVHYEINYSSVLPGTEINSISAKALAGESSVLQKKSKNAERIKAIEEDIDLEELFDYSSPRDMLECFGKSPILNRYVYRIGFVKTMSLAYPLTRRKQLMLLDGADDKISKIYNEHREEINNLGIRKEIYEDIPVYLKKFPDEFDLNGILIIAAYRAYNYLEGVNLTEEERKKYARILQVATKHINSRSVVLEDLHNREKDTKKDSFSYHDMVRACERISSEGEYVSKRQEESMKSEMLSKSGSLEKMNPEIVRMIHLSMEDYKNIISNDSEALKYFVENGLISERNLEEIVRTTNLTQDQFAMLVENGSVNEKMVQQYFEKQGNIQDNLFTIVDEKNLLSDLDKLQYYLEGKISVDVLLKMSDEKKSSFSELLSTERFAELYRNPDQKDKYDRYVNVFRAMILAEKTKEERYEIGEKIIEAIDIDIENEDLVRLYQEHLISLTSVESWGGSPLITEMMRNAMLRPADVNDICRSGDYSAVIDIMKDKKIPRKDKLAIFYTTFADADDELTEEERFYKKMAQRECLKHIRFSEESIKNPVKSGERTRIKSEGTKKSKEYVFEPLNRWTLIRALDSEYSYEILDQGMMIFKLPNVNSGVVILEKMFKREEPDYGRATKFINISIEEFEKIKKELIISGDIPVFAVDSHPRLQGIVDSIAHTPTWAKRLADDAGYKTDQRRSEEYISKVDKEIARTLASRRLREE